MTQRSWTMHTDNALDMYQRFTQSLACYNEDVFYKIGEEYHKAPWTYPATALAEEAGEVNGKIAKYVRKSDTDFSTLRAAVAKELGDVLYQLSETARQFGFKLSEIAAMNVDKLTDRQERGVLVGVGDER